MLALTPVSFGTESSSPERFTNVAGLAYFTAGGFRPDGTGFGLFRSDGTAAGTTLLKDFGSSGNGPQSLTPLGQTLFFTAGDSTGRELWKTDGTPGGTARVADIAPGADSSQPLYLTVLGDALYFSATNPTTGRELYRSDGTADGTTLVKDIWAGSSSGGPGEMVVSGTALYFAASDATNGVGLWKSDGTASGTAFIKDVVPGVTSEVLRYLTPMAGRVYFVAGKADLTEQEVWSTDGTADGTAMLKDIVPGSAGSAPASLTVVGGARLFFAANAGASTGTELWTSDGTEAGTVQVIDLNPGPDSASPAAFTAAGDRLYFTANDGTALASSLWVTDGTAGGTVKLPGNSPASPGLVGNRLYFSANDSAVPTQRRLWSSDGTQSGTAPLPGVPFNSVAASPPVDVAGAAWFGADDAFNGLEPWRLPAGGSASQLVADLNARPIPISALTFSANGSLFYSSPGRGLARLDGATGSVTWLGSYAPSAYAALGGTVLFATGADSRTPALWATDGTAAGTRLLHRASLPSPLSGSILDLTVGKTKAYFRSRTGPATQYNYQDWETDGTLAGTRLAVLPKETPAPAPPVSLNGYQYHLDAGGGPNIWRTDGTPYGDIQISRLGTTNSPLGSRLARAGEMVFHAVQDRSDGLNYTLYATDPAAGTRSVGKFVAVNADPANAAIGPIVTAAGAAYFAGRTDADGIELWTSDGLRSTRVTDLMPGGGSSYPSNLTVVGNSLYFMADDPAGRRWWRLEAASPAPEPAVAGLHTFIDPGGTQVSLLWTVTQNSPDLVHIQRSRVSDFSTIEHSWTVLLQNPGESFRDDMVVPGTRYYYRVTRYNSGGEGVPATVEALTPQRPIAADVIDSASAGGRLGDLQPFANGILFRGDPSNGTRFTYRNTTGSQAGDLTSSPVAVLGERFFYFFKPATSGAKWELRAASNSAGSEVIKRQFNSVAGPVSFGGRFYFVADNPSGAAGTILWKSDGTTLGTVPADASDARLLPVVEALNAGATTVDAATLGGATYFAGNVTGRGRQLFRSDGTPSGTAQLTEVANAPSGATFAPRQFVSAGGFVYFFGPSVNADGSFGAPALWRTDGSAGGTTQVFVLPPDSQTPAELRQARGRLYFQDGVSLWTSDGTAGGTVRLTTALPLGATVKDVTPFGDGRRIYFTTHFADGSTRADNSPSYTGELWVTDGTPAGTARVPGLMHTIGVRATSPSNLAASAGLLYFTADGSDNAERQLFSMMPMPDGTSEALAAPTHLSADASVARQVTLSWADPNVGETGYRVLRNTSASGWASAAVTDLAADATMFVDTTVAPGTNYYYRVIAVDAVGTSTAAPIGPIAGAGGPAAPTNLRYALVDGNRAVRLDWTDNATDETGYIVERSSTTVFNETPSSNWNVLPVDLTSTTDPGVVQYSSYYYRVTAVKGALRSSGAVIGPVEIAPRLPNVPTDLRGAGIGTNAIELQWTDNADDELAANGYRVERAGPDGVFSTVATLPRDSKTFTDNVPFGTYTYRIRVTNVNASVLSATTVTVTPLPPDLTTPIASLPPIPDTSVLTGADPGPVFDTGAGAGYTFVLDYNFSPSPLKLWRTDGTPNGTYMVHDFGRYGGGTALLARNGLCYFEAFGELWRTDGTDAGTIKLSPSIVNSSTAYAAPNGLVYFEKTSGVIYQTDGTAAGTFAAPAGTTLPAPPPQPGDDGAFIEGWAYYGTGTGIDRKNVATGATETFLNLGGEPQKFASLGTKLVYAFNRVDSSFVDRRELYVIDVNASLRTPTLLTSVATQQPGFKSLKVIGNRLFAAFQNGNYDLWISDLTPAGTYKYTTVQFVADQFGSANGKLTFRGGAPTQLWASDGTAAGTMQVSKMNPHVRPAHPDFVATAGGIGFFASSQLDDPGHTAEQESGQALYRTDGTPDGTFRLFDGPVRDIVAMGSQVFFISGVTIWKSDGTVAGTVMVTDTHQGTVRLLASANGRIFMAVGITPGQYALWTTDGTAGGTISCGSSIRLYSSTNRSSPLYAVADGLFYFITGYENGQYASGGLMRSNGTPGGTSGVAGIPAAAQCMAAVGNALFVASFGGLYRVPNAGASAALLKGNIAPFLGYGPPLICELAAVGSKLFFSAPGAQAGDGFVLWVSDGTGTGTRPVADTSAESFSAGPGEARPQMITAVGNTAYFLSADRYELGIGPDPTAALWKSDGTAEGTVKIRSFDLSDPDSAGPRPLFLTAVAGQLVYSDADYLWRSDGTWAGTVRIDNVGTAPDNTRSPAIFAGGAFAVFGDRIVYSATASGGGRPLRIATLTPPAAPSDVTFVSTPSFSLPSLTVPGSTTGPASATTPDVVLHWTDNAATETGFVIERSTSAAFAAINQTYYAAANATSASLPGEDGTYYYRVRAVNAGGASAPAVAGTDLVPPTVTGIVFDGRAAPTRVRVTFSENVSATLGASNLTVVRRAAAGSGGADVPVAFTLLSYDRQSNVATFAPAAGPNVTASGLLVDGDYRATVVPGGVKDLAGNALMFAQGVNASVDAFVLAGDADGDRTVGPGDFNVLASHFGQGGQTWATGDFDGDGVVGAADFNLLASRFGTTLIPPTESLTSSLAAVRTASGGPTVARAATEQGGSGIVTTPRRAPRVLPRRPALTSRG